jgi:preprotein translocase subunit YajC
MTSAFLLMGQPPEGTPQSPFVVFFPYLLILFIFYFLLIRPQQKRANEHRKFVEQLKNGDKVVTDSGLFGSVVGVDEDSIVLKIDDNVKVRILKGKVAGMQPTADAKKKPAPAAKKK